MFAKIQAWLTSTAWPAIESFMGGIVHTEVAALTPVAESAVATLTADEVAALASGNTKDTGHILAKVVAQTTQAAETAGIQAGASSILTAVGAAVVPKASS